jgi:hypothetical protein
MIIKQLFIYCVINCDRIVTFKALGEHINGNCWGTGNPCYSRALGHSMFDVGTGEQ